MRTRKSEVTDYQYTTEDFGKYFDSVLGLYNGNFVIVTGYEEVEVDYESDDDHDPDNGPPINLKVRDISTNEIETISCEDLVLSKPNGITFELPDPAVSVGYIYYNPSGYKKGVSTNEYYLSLPVASACIISEPFDIKAGLGFLWNSHSLIALYLRKRTLDLTKFKEMVDGDRLGAIIDQNYYFSYREEDISLYYKQYRVGYLSKNKLFVVKKTKRLQRLANKIGYSLEET